MSEEKFTPGPWQVDSSEACLCGNLLWSKWWVIDAEHKHRIAFCDTTCESAVGKIRANFNLIAAAPELYEALSFCYDHIRDAANNDVDIRALAGEMEWRVREALQKARGES